MASTIVTFELGGREVEVMVRPMTTLQSVLRYQLGLDGDEGGLPAGRLRELHGPRRRRADAVLPAAGRGRRRTAGDDAREPHPGGGAPPDPAGVRRRRCLPVRLLHAGHGHGREGPARPRPGTRRPTTSRRRSPATSAAAPGTGPSSRRSRTRPRTIGDDRRTGAMSALNVVGRSVGRSDAIGHVTGRTQFTADRVVPRHAPPQDGPQPAPPRPDPGHRPDRGGARARASSAP